MVVATATEREVATSSSTMMRSAIFMDEEEWPTLGGGEVSDSAANSATCATEDWEMLQQETDLLSFEVVEVSREADAPQITSVVDQQIGATNNNDNNNNNKPINRKMLRHYESSPNLSSLDKIVEQTPPTLNLPEAVHEEDDSFALVSGPPSVLTSTTTSLFSGVTWADMAGSQPQTPTQHSKRSNVETRSEPRTRIQPKFVVVHTPFQMRRCSRSTGDLKTLAEVDAEDAQHSGACDAMEFYNRKAVGAAARTNGLKLRPDELARKQIILNKKSEQRLKQHQQTTNTRQPK